jgi:hypothetical protein
VIWVVFLVWAGFVLLLVVGGFDSHYFSLRVWLFLDVCVRNVGRGVLFVYTFSTYSVYTQMVLGQGFLGSMLSHFPMKEILSISVRKTG